MTISDSSSKCQIKKGETFPISDLALGIWSLGKILSNSPKYREKKHIIINIAAPKKPTLLIDQRILRRIPSSRLRGFRHLFGGRSIGWISYGYPDFSQRFRETSINLSTLGVTSCESLWQPADGGRYSVETARDVSQHPIELCQRFSAQMIHEDGSCKIHRVKSENG